MTRLLQPRLTRLLFQFVITRRIHAIFHGSVCTTVARPGSCLTGVTQLNCWFEANYPSTWPQTEKERMEVGFWRCLFAFDCIRGQPLNSTTKSSRYQETVGGQDLSSILGPIKPQRACRHTSWSQGRPFGSIEFCAALCILTSTHRGAMHGAKHSTVAP